jgi:hypothetical protein
LTAGVAAEQAGGRSRRFWGELDDTDDVYDTLALKAHPLRAATATLR